MREDKQRICDLLLPALQATRAFHDLVNLRYSKETKGKWKEEKVCATFDNGYTRSANVTADSGISMIQDILRQII